MRLFLVILVVALLGAAGGGYVVYRQAAVGEPANQLEALYTTPADRFVRIDSARVRVREEGPRDAPAIILLHGFTHSLETWDAWAADLKTDHRVIRYDLLGHGLTGPDPKERYAPEERARFLGDVMDALGIERATIGGNSLGGLAAWRFAAIAPSRVEALVLVSPAAFAYNGVSDTPAPIPTPMKAFLMAAPEAGVRASADIVFGEMTPSPERLTLWRDMMRREGNGAAMIRSLEKFTLPDPAADLARVTAPTLLIWGGDDAVVPLGNGERMLAAMPNASLKVYPGVGHAAQEETPARSLADVRAFLAAIPANAAAAGPAAPALDAAVELNAAAAPE